MALKPCLKCGTPTRGSYCEQHKGLNGGTGQRGSTAGWRQLRELVLERDGYRCTATIDGDRCPATAHLHADHIRSKRDGGPDTMSNLATLCRRHNLEKGAR